ncbi:MAG: phosphatase PAP2 family protein [Bacteroidota bacterium]
MIEWLESIDRSIVLTVNSWHTPVLDEIFWFISARWPWIPLYLILLFLSWNYFGTRKTLLFVGITVATIVIVDLTSVYFFKEVFQRYRPSHHALLTHKLHFYHLGKGEFYKGGMYGFVSSHATNFAAMTVLIGLSLRPRYPKLIWILVGISVLIAFSRIYLGVHYLSDIIVGTIWGGTLAYLSYRFVVKRWLIKTED